MNWPGSAMKWWKSEFSVKLKNSYLWTDSSNRNGIFSIYININKIPFFDKNRNKDTEYFKSRQQSPLCFVFRAIWTKLGNTCNSLQKLFTQVQLWQKTGLRDIGKDDFYNRDWKRAGSYLENLRRAGGRQVGWWEGGFHWPTVENKLDPPTCSPAYLL